MFRISDINSEVVKSALSHKMGLKIGTNREFSYDDVEEVTGIKARTIKSYCEGASLIPLDNFLKIACAIDSSNILNAPFELVGFGGLHRVTGEGCTGNQILSSISKRLSMIAGHLEDGRIDHTEKAEQKRELAQLASEVLSYTKGL